MVESACLPAACSVQDGGRYVERPTRVKSGLDDSRLTRDFRLQDGRLQASGFQKAGDRSSSQTGHRIDEVDFRFGFGFRGYVNCLVLMMELTNACKVVPRLLQRAGN